MIDLFIFFPNDQPTIKMLTTSNTNPVADETPCSLPRLVTVRHGLIRVTIHGLTEYVTHPLIDLHEGKNVLIHDDLSIFQEGGGKRIGTGTVLRRMGGYCQPKCLSEQPVRLLP